MRVNWEGTASRREGGGDEGRVWFDPDTFDVLQIDIRLSKPFLVPLRSGATSGPFSRQSEWNDRKSTMHFSRVEFQQPDEVVLLAGVDRDPDRVPRRAEPENQPEV